MAIVGKAVSIWAESSGDEEEDDGEVVRQTTPAGNPFLNGRPGFAPFQLYGRRKRGRPSGRECLVPVAEQTPAKQGPNKAPRPPGVEVRRFLDELRNFTVPAAADTKPRKGRRLRFDCPKGRDFDPPREQHQDDDDPFRPSLFDFVRMDREWKDPATIFDKHDPPKSARGRPRTRPAKLPGKGRGRPRKVVQTEEAPKEKRPKGRPRMSPREEQPFDPAMIFSFEDGEANEEDIEKMISKGMLVINANARKFLEGLKAPGRPQIHPVKPKVAGRKLGRPRIHPFKMKVPGRMRGRPRVHPPKEKVPGRVRGRPRVHPPREKVPGRARGRPRIHPAKEKVEGRPRGRPRVHPSKVKVPGRPRGRPRVRPVKEKVAGRKRGRPAKTKVVVATQVEPIEKGGQVDNLPKVEKVAKKRGRKRKGQQPETLCSDLLALKKCKPYFEGENKLLVKIKGAGKKRGRKSKVTAEST
ncbi:muscle M-line assembly protein unc-89-like [Neocloeon triangulifer]|uniref:muscle M-line assembly protein unc-89-like n=1 Tax=Neocloeon triangulifer TaxID=2078957 RepID=UPI00286FA879|nr:muscle M-line assembly protein unc-89-like [Neocloeon triangulifer]